ncbi:hypothetical protein EQ500_07980, partial [Lactobacillus sp. XV13L]|nr:hypothetical protein [Lactobacillus sp. XV13L]
MKNFKYRKLVAGVLAAAGLAGGLSWGANRLAAEDISAAATLKVPSLADAAKWTVSYDEQAPQAPGIGMKSGRVIKKTNFYNKKGRKIKKSVLKKGKKLTVVGSQKIRGKKFYLVIQGKFVPANCIMIKKVRVQKPAATPVKQAEPKKAKATIADFSLSEFRQEFLKVLNDERTKRGLTPVTADTHYDEVTQERTKLLPANFSHNGKSGNFILEDYYKQAGISFN